MSESSKTSPDQAPSSKEEATLSDRLDRQAARTPEATAVSYRGTRLSYAELDRRANRLARQLVALGAGPERSVAIALPRTELMMVAVLAGGADRSSSW